MISSISYSKNQVYLPTMTKKFFYLYLLLTSCFLLQFTPAQAQSDPNCVKTQEDVNFDCKVNIEDYAIFITHYGSDAAESTYNSVADVNQDNYIDIKDFYVLINNWGKVLPPIPPNSTPTMTPTPTVTRTPSQAPNPTATPTPNANVQHPSGLSTINWAQWKITLPDGSEVKDLINKSYPNYFYLSPSKDAVVFRTPINDDNGTTARSSNVRSELREREIVSDTESRDIYWTTQGTHILYVKQKITHLTMTVPIMVASQVHGCKDPCSSDVGSVDDSAVLRLEGDKLYISFNGGSEMIGGINPDGTKGKKITQPNHLIGNYQLGTMMEFIIEIKNGKHQFYYSTDGNLETAYTAGVAQNYLIKKGDQPVLLDLNYGDAYFKVGNYTQSNSDKEGSNNNKPENYGEVLVYKAWVRHQ